MTELWTDIEGVDPGVLGRCGWDVDEAQRDVEVLAWVGRFRFVTAQAIGERFGVSWQRANARVRRLERRGLVGCERAHVSQPRAVFLTGRSHELLGWPRRRAPRADVQREHEAAIVALVTRLERDAGPATRVLTERECRQLEPSDRATRYSVDVLRGGQRDRRRWPDVVVELGEGRRAIEIEFAPKGTRGCDRSSARTSEASTARRCSSSRTPHSGAASPGSSADSTVPCASSSASHVTSSRSCPCPSCPWRNVRGWPTPSLDRGSRREPGCIAAV